MFEPSMFARWIFSVSKSVQYILPPATSNAMPSGLLNPCVTRSSMFEPSMFTRWILSVPPSVQKIVSMSSFLFAVTGNSVVNAVLS